MKGSRKMRRFPRRSPSAGCIIPGTAIAWIILTMAIITILSLVLIKMRRIINSKDAVQIGIISYNDSSHTEDNAITTQLVDSTAPASLAQHLAETKISSEEALLEDGLITCFERPFLLILATSSPENFERRDAIRKTWSKRGAWRRKFPDAAWRTVFLVGRYSTRFVDLLVQRENDISRDILIGQYRDTYRNLTLKVMHGFKWAAHNCQPDFILKTDDDCFVNVPLLIQFLAQFRPMPTNIYAGHIKWSAPVVRDHANQWYVSKSQHPKPMYAPYANGAGYILSSYVLELLVTLSNKTPVFPNEDAYVGTVLNLAGVKPIYSTRFVAQPGPWQVCNYKYLFIIHRIKATLQREQQEIANKAEEECLDSNNQDWV